jgi:hypothetical protein
MTFKLIRERFQVVFKILFFITRKLLPREEDDQVSHSFIYALTVTLGTYNYSLHSLDR